MKRGGAAPLRDIAERRSNCRRTHPFAISPRAGGREGDRARALRHRGARAEQAHARHLLTPTLTPVHLQSTKLRGALQQFDLHFNESKCYWTPPLKNQFQQGIHIYGAKLFPECLFFFVTDSRVTKQCAHCLSPQNVKRFKVSRA